MIQQIEKGYDEMENCQLPTHKNISCTTRYAIVQKLSNKQSAKVFLGLIDLENLTARDRKAISALKRLSGTHAFNNIVLRVNLGLTSCEDLAMALSACKLQ